MADETGKISGAGQGFFKADGVLKSKEELAADTSQKTSKQSEEPVETTFESDVSNVLSKIENRFVERANSALESVSQQQENLQEARKLINEQLTAARDLKEALKNDDQERAQKLQEQLQELNEKRTELSKRIDLDNRKTATDRNQQLRLGNEEIAKVAIKPVELKSDKNFDAKKIDKAKEADAFIEELKKEKAAVKEQVSELRETKKQITSAVREAKDRIKAIRRNSVSTFEDAQKLTDKIANGIQSAGIKSVEDTISSRLTPSLVSRFLQ